MRDLDTNLDSHEGKAGLETVLLYLGTRRVSGERRTLRRAEGAETAAAS
jgi:hypothetical protein